MTVEYVAAADHVVTTWAIEVYPRRLIAYPKLPERRPIIGLRESTCRHVDGSVNGSRVHARVDGFHKNNRRAIIIVYARPLTYGACAQLEIAVVEVDALVLGNAEDEAASILGDNPARVARLHVEICTWPVHNYGIVADSVFVACAAVLDCDTRVWIS